MRASWKVNCSRPPQGPWVIQLCVTHKGHGSYSPPLPQHQGFQSRKEAEAAKKKMPQPIIRHGIVIDGVTVSGVAY